MSDTKGGEPEYFSLGEVMENCLTSDVKTLKEFCLDRGIQFPQDVQPLVLYKAGFQPSFGRKPVKRVIRKVP